MNLSDLLPPERVREIAAMSFDDFGRCDPVFAINAATPEIARAVLEMAARRCDDLIFGVEIEEWAKMTKKEVSARACMECAATLHQMAKKISAARAAPSATASAPLPDAADAPPGTPGTICSSRPPGAGN